MRTIEIFKLFGSILVDNDKANESISKTEKKADGLGKKFLDGAKTVGKWGVAAGGAAVAVGGAMFAMATKAGDAADRLLDLKAITGMSTDEIQKWEKATKIAGVSIDSMTNASQKLTKQLNTMDEEGNKSRQALEGLGLSVEEISSMNADERMDAITQALAGVEDGTDRARLGTDLLGGSWKEIAPIVDMGTEAMQKAKDSANIVSEEDLNKANNFRIRIAELRDQFSHYAMMLGVKVLPIMDKFLDWIEQYMPQIQEVASIVFSAISDGISLFIEWIGKLITWLKDWYDNNQETIESIKEGFQDFVDSVVNLVEGFISLFKKMWEKYGDHILKIITNRIDLIKAVFQTAFDLIVDIFNIFASLFKGDWEQLWKDVKTLASNLWDNIKNIIGTAVDNVVGMFKDINLYQIGKDIIQGLINGLSNMSAKLREKASEIASSIGNKVKSFFGIRSPSKLMMEYGGHIGEGLAIGVSDSKKKVTQATEDINSAALNGIANTSGISASSGSSPTINITLDNAIITDDYGVDRLMERIVERLQSKAGLAL